MKKKLFIYFKRIHEHLWFRPFLFCLVSVAGALVANQADGMGIEDLVPNIEKGSIGSLLDVLSSSMLVISIFAVASMLSAFASASSKATPRSFKIVVTDDVSQYALSIFIGAFIFSIVATIALDNGYYGKSGRFVLFLFTIILFALVILTFLRWVDRISRLGRLEYTILQLEEVATQSLTSYVKYPNKRGIKVQGEFRNGQAVLSDSVGYVQHVNWEALQILAEENDLKIRLNCLPGKAVHRNYILAWFRSGKEADEDQIQKEISESIHVGKTRQFDEDPRFGLISLTEIASRALSPGINDPGTAIQIIGSHERLFFLWHQEVLSPPESEEPYNRLEVPDISMDDFFADAFRPIARDGAGNIEVMLRLQKTLGNLAGIENAAIREQAMRHSEEAYRRAEKAMDFPGDLDRLSDACLFKKS